MTRKIKCGGKGFTIGEIHKIVKAIPVDAMAEFCAERLEVTED